MRSVLAAETHRLRSIGYPTSLMALRMRILHYRDLCTDWTDRWPLCMVEIINIHRIPHSASLSDRRMRKPLGRKKRGFFERAWQMGTSLLLRIDVWGNLLDKCICCNYAFLASMTLVSRSCYMSKIQWIECCSFSFGFNSKSRSKAMSHFLSDIA